MIPSDYSLHVDFDRTLFDTPRFSADLHAILSEKSGVPVEQIRADAKHFISHEGLGGYDFEGHVSSYGDYAEMMWTELEQLVAAKDYLYPDSAGFMRDIQVAGFEPRILSFGETRFQMLKIEGALQFIRPLHPIHIEVVMRRKGEFLAESFPGRRGALIDDIPNQELPDGFMEINIDRDTKFERPELTDGGFLISDLEQAKQLIIEIDSKH